MCLSPHYLSLDARRVKQLDWRMLQYWCGLGHCPATARPLVSALLARRGSLPYSAFVPPHRWGCVGMWLLALGTVARLSAYLRGAEYLVQ
ncbi:hypothetical protein BDU57DRAFT_157577 [Ampelomyces quisqualis]|uniref:Uncharacterized protein n=1 Tax=Ampelomyces quisqualis TaxID=50730 RepID=A0A6A5QZK1_AMPQU|nr:hypothetical protein BDU57DRAFT_157577 [Ampelomyces quisqualis]